MKQISIEKVVVALGIAFYSPYPIGFWLTTIAFGLYALSFATTAARTRLAARLAPVGG